ncbi:armadillo-type protein [Syncephalastrum racemosum]|uniref:Armadillo-type protein n=1 Tax=Syncephalastrum racemosum TaxID=13706 RepID=A0A1X2HM70_SYNRA|nr:armadillo-type protein [Syncephalastrum racemosum]
MSYNESRANNYRPRRDYTENRHHRSYGNRPYNRDDRRNNNRRGPRRHHSPAREDDTEDIEVRLRGLIIKIGDKISPELQVNLNKMKNILESDYAKYPEAVQATLRGCITDLPAKAPVYGTLLGLLNVSSHDLTAKLVQVFNDDLTQAAADGEWFRLKQILRFYGELVNANVIMPSAYCDILNDILSILDEPDIAPRRADCAIFIILATLPWSGKELQARSSTELTQILNRINVYMESRGKHANLDIMKQYRSGKQVADQDTLAHLWQFIQDLRFRDWENNIIPALHSWFDREFSGALQHDVPRLEIAKHTDASEYIGPQVPFKIHVDDNGATLPNVPNHDSFAYFILQDVMTDTLDIFEPNRKECSKYVLSIGNNFEQGLFVQQRNADEDEDMNDREGWNLSDFIMEVTFAQILKLPTPPFRPVFYTCVLSELCRADQSPIPRALGRSVKILFDRLQDMDAECISRFCSWFAHHLSNFSFTWDWQAWEGVLTLDPKHPQVCFVRETLDKMTRLSYYERIKESIPPSFAPIFPAAEPAPVFEYQDPAHPFHQAAQEVVAALRSKRTVDDLRATLDRIGESAGDDKHAQADLVHKVFLQSLLFVGSKSFSHALNVVERYLEVLRWVNSNPETRTQTVSIVASFWRHNTQFLSIMVDKLLNYRVIDPTSVVTWAFESDQLAHVERSYIWEILRNTLNKVVARVSQVRAKLQSYEAMHAENEAKRSQAPMTEMAQADAQQEQDTIRIAENSLSTVTREQKEVFVATYQKFVQTLQSAMQQVSADQAEADLSWDIRWLLGWFREMLRSYYKECSTFTTTLETVVFTPDVDSRIAALFADIQVLLRR